MLRHGLFAAGRAMTRGSRSVFAKGASSDIATRLTTNSWARTIGSDALRTGGKALRWGARNNMRAYGMTGALAGGAYGAVSDDTSVIGGALMGAGLGVGGVAAARGGMGVANRYAAARALTQTRGEAFKLAGMASGRHIGRTLTKKASSVGSSMKMAWAGNPQSSSQLGRQGIKGWWSS